MNTSSQTSTPNASARRPIGDLTLTEVEETANALGVDEVGLAVALSKLPDPKPARTILTDPEGEVRVWSNGQSVILTVDNGESAAAVALTDAQARRVAAAVVQGADENIPLRRDGFDVITSALGLTVEEIAQAAGVDLATATRADEWELAQALGTAAGHPKGVRIGLGV